MFLGNALGALFGTDDSIINTTTYTDYMTAAKPCLQTQISWIPMDTAQDLRNMNGLRLYGSKNGDHMLAWYDGAIRIFCAVCGGSGAPAFPDPADEYQDALYGVENSAGTAIDDLRLWNIAVEDHVVYYYLYYDAARLCWALPMTIRRQCWQIRRIPP